MGIVGFDFGTTNSVMSIISGDRCIPILDRHWHRYVWLGDVNGCSPRPSHDSVADSSKQPTNMHY